ncbi:MAG: hypothetical protein KKB15_02190, partial [Bacteroidetes bacterium]|nr:hypothetical protein [Bacteroidota bacterium]
NSNPTGRRVFNKGTRTKLFVIQTKSKTTNMTMKKSPAGNIGLAIWRLECFYETFVQGSTAVILLNFRAKIRHIAKP